MRLAITLFIPIAMTILGSPSSAKAEQSNSAWITMAKIIKDGERTGPPAVYLRKGLVLTAAHVVSVDAKMSVQIAGVTLPAKILKQGLLEDVDLSLLAIDEEKFPSRLALPEMRLCTAPPWPGDPVIVVDGNGATRSHIISPHILHFIWRSKFSTLIADVATTGNSGSGVFDPDRKCLHGIMSRKFMADGKDIAKYFVPATEIREFLPPEFRY